LDSFALTLAMNTGEGSIKQKCQNLSDAVPDGEFAEFASHALNFEPQYARGPDFESEIAIQKKGFARSLRKHGFDVGFENGIWYVRPMKEAGVDVKTEEQELNSGKYIEVTRTRLQEDVERPHQELSENPKAVYIVHGRNMKVYDSLVTFLSSIGLQPQEFAKAVIDTGKTNPYVGEVLDAAFAKAQAIVVLMTPDDEAQLREPYRKEDDPPHETKLTPQPRQNVLFEAGIAMGRSEKRTVIVELGALRPFSDIGGRHVVRLNNTAEKRKELAYRLRTAGCPIDLSGDYWLRGGDFEGSVIDSQVRQDATVEKTTGVGSMWAPFISALNEFLRKWHDYQRLGQKRKTVDIVDLKYSLKNISKCVNDWAETAPADIRLDVRNFSEKLGFISTSEDTSLIDQIGKEAYAAAQKHLKHAAQTLAELWVESKMPKSKFTEWKFEPMEEQFGLFTKVKGTVIDSSGGTHYFKIGINPEGEVADSLSMVSQ